MRADVGVTEAPARGSPAWRGFRQRIGAGWTSTDTLVLATSAAACAGFGMLTGFFPR